MSKQVAAARDGASVESDRRGAASVEAMLAEVDVASPFGPLFFLQQLRSCIRERCPDPGEELPSVELHLFDGTRLQVCHVMCLAPRWVALAVPGASKGPMRTELVPYAAIARVTVRGGAPRRDAIGFDASRTPLVLGGEGEPHRSAEEMLEVLASGAPTIPTESRRKLAP